MDGNQILNESVVASRTEETASSEENTDTEELVSSEENNATESERLPEISEIDTKVILVKYNNYAVEMQKCVNFNTKVVKKCEIYITENGIPTMDEDANLSIKKDKIMNANDYTVMIPILRSFEINFTEDQIKTSFERAKRFLELCTKSTNVAKSMTIVDTYKMLIETIMTRAGLQQNNEDGLNYIYDPKQKTVCIESTKINGVLSEIGSGFTATKLCHKLSILEQSIGKKLIYRHSSRNGFSLNLTGNKHYYKFYVEESLLSLETTEEVENI